MLDKGLGGARLVELVAVKDGEVDDRRDVVRVGLQRAAVERAHNIIIRYFNTVCCITSIGVRKYL